MINVRFVLQLVEPIFIHFFIIIITVRAIVILKWGSFIQKEKSMLQEVLIIRICVIIVGNSFHCWILGVSRHWKVLTQDFVALDHQPIVFSDADTVFDWFFCSGEGVSPWPL